MGDEAPPIRWIRPARTTAAAAPRKPSLSARQAWDLGYGVVDAVMELPSSRANAEQKLPQTNYEEQASSIQSLGKHAQLPDELLHPIAGMIRNKADGREVFVALGKLNEQVRRYLAQ